MTELTSQAAAGDGAVMAGFPPAPQARVTLANWQDPPFNRWAFRHMRELIPSQPIPAGPRPSPLAASGLELGNPPVTRPDGSSTTVRDVLATTFTDAFVVLYDGRLVAELYDDGMSAGTSHLLMSVSKSMVGCVTAVLAGRGLLDIAAPVTRYVPEVSGSGYAGATIRDLLDMRTGVAFRLPVPGHPGQRRPARRRFLLPVGRHRHARLGVRAGQRHQDGRSAVGADLAADRRRTRRRDHLRPARLRRPRRRHLRHRPRPGQVRAVVVKLSSWPDAQHAGYLIDTLRACAAIAAHLPG
jgi:CubicO group peptidase (beta-lactamase class C family)